MYRHNNSHVSREDAVDQVLLWQVERDLQLIVIKRDFSRAGAVESGLHEGGPGILQKETSAHVILTDPSHAREHHLPTVIFNSRFPHEEVGEATDFINRHKMRFWGNT